jgi:hypothetical protein
MNHDLVTQMVTLLGQFLVDNADTVSGKVVAAAPVAGVVASGLVEKAWVKVAVTAVGSLLTALFNNKPSDKPTVFDDQQKG